jgi:hypothetical protein
MRQPRVRKCPSNSHGCSSHKCGNHTCNARNSVLRWMPHRRPAVLSNKRPRNKPPFSDLCNNVHSKPLSSKVGRKSRKPMPRNSKTHHAHLKRKQCRAGPLQKRLSQ